jgi:hypothetical protein
MSSRRTNLSQSASTTPRCASKARQQRQAFRLSNNKRVHEQLYGVSDELRQLDVDASGFARIWIGVGLQIAASILETCANRCLVEDIIKESGDE